MAQSWKVKEEKEIDRDDKQQQLIRDFHGTFATEEGKRVVERLSNLCNENEPTYVDGNAMGTAYKEGQRSIILHIRKMLKKKPGEKKQEQARSQL